MDRYGEGYNSYSWHQVCPISSIPHLGVVKEGANGVFGSFSLRVRAGNRTVVSRPGTTLPSGIYFPQLTRPSDLARSQATVLVIVPYDTVEEDVVVCTASDGGPRADTTPELIPWPWFLGRFRGELPCGGRSWPGTHHKSAYSNQLLLRFGLSRRLGFE